MVLNCPCPFIPCKLRGNCAACMTKNRKDHSLPNCMEDIAVDFGAILPLRYPATTICESFEELSRLSALELASAVNSKPDALLCIPAGKSAIRTFEILVNMVRKGDLNLGRARFVQLDEWLDIESEEENCSAFLNRHFYGPAGIRKEQIMRMDIHAADLQAECERFDRYLLENGPVDFMLLGLGMNAHLGLNEPGISWDNGTIVVELSETTAQVGQKYFEKGQTLTRGITLGMRHVYAAKRVVLQVGELKKAEIVRAVYHSAPSVKLPGTVMKLLSNALVILDRDAASLLDENLLKENHAVWA